MEKQMAAYLQAFTDTAMHYGAQFPGAAQNTLAWTGNFLLWSAENIGMGIGYSLNALGQALHWTAFTAVPYTANGLYTGGSALLSGILNVVKATGLFAYNAAPIIWSVGVNTAALGSILGARLLIDQVIAQDQLKTQPMNIKIAARLITAAVISPLASAALTLAGASIAAYTIYPIALFFFAAFDATTRNYFANNLNAAECMLDKQAIVNVLPSSILIPQDKSLTTLFPEDLDLNSIVSRYKFTGYNLQTVRLSAQETTIIAGDDRADASGLLNAIREAQTEGTLGGRWLSLSRWESSITRQLGDLSADNKIMISTALWAHMMEQVGPFKVNLMPETGAPAHLHRLGETWDYQIQVA